MPVIIIRKSAPFSLRRLSRPRSASWRDGGIDDGDAYTLEEVGEIFKVARERVRQVEANAIRKLQHPARARKLEGFLVEGDAPQDQ